MKSLKLFYLFTVISLIVGCKKDNASSTTNTGGNTNKVQCRFYKPQTTWIFVACGNWTQQENVTWATDSANGAVWDVINCTKCDSLLHTFH